MATFLATLYVLSITLIFGIGLIRMFIIREDFDISDISDIIATCVVAVVPGINCILAIELLSNLLTTVQMDYYWDGEARRFLKRDEE